MESYLLDYNIFTNIAKLPKVTKNTPKVILCGQKIKRNSHLKKKIVKNILKNSNSYKVLLPLEYIYAFCNKVLVAVWREMSKKQSYMLFTKS